MPGLQTHKPYLPRVAVIGGGRWARVILDVLDKFLPENILVSAHSVRGADDLDKWAANCTVRRRLVISSQWPDLNASRDCAVIIVNAVRDHAEAAMRALTASAAVLVEKPVALFSSEITDLIKLAELHTACFSAAHVFSFSRYLFNFRQLIASQGNLQVLRIRWADQGKGELRYGEIKQYDPGLPVYADWLPHVFSMLHVINPDCEPLVTNVHIDRGGANVKIECSLGDIACYVDLERNSGKRERLIEARCQGNKVCKLDFTDEPGQIFDGIHLYDGDTQWSTASKPLATMLDAFLTWAAGGPFDSRLDIQVGLKASLLIEQVKALYDQELDQWISDKLILTPHQVDVDLHYALAERDLQN